MEVPFPENASVDHDRPSDFDDSNGCRRPGARRPPGATSLLHRGSVGGNYGAVATYGANVARALGFEIMDGHGKITAGSAIANQPGPNNTRTLSTIGITGTYTINAEGMGTMSSMIAVLRGVKPAPGPLKIS